MYSHDNLKSLCLYQLRNYGRSIGVPAPTNKNKPELIQSIKDILDGITPPTKTNKGRRPKTFITSNQPSMIDHEILKIKFKELTDMINIINDIIKR